MYKYIICILLAIGLFGSAIEANAGSKLTLINESNATVIVRIEWVNHDLGCYQNPRTGITRCDHFIAVATSYNKGHINLIGEVADGRWVLELGGYAVKGNIFRVHWSYKGRHIKIDEFTIENENVEEYVFSLRSFY